jgi:hypothetical protein
LSKDGRLKMTLAHFFHKNLLVSVALNLSLLPSGQLKENAKYASFHGAKRNRQTIGKSIDDISPRFPFHNLYWYTIESLILSNYTCWAHV